MCTVSPSRPAIRSAPASWLEDATAARLLRYAAFVYLVAWAVHTGDHLRRGFDVVTAAVTVLGSVTAVLQLAVIAAVLMRRHWAPIAAVAVGFPDAIGIAAVHLLPNWGALSDAFPGAHNTGVTGFSWLAAIVEITGALAFGLCGLYAWWAPNQVTGSTGEQPHHLPGQHARAERPPPRIDAPHQLVEGPQDQRTSGHAADHGGRGA